MKSSDVLTVIRHMPSSRVLLEWPFPCDSMVCGHLRWKMACRACFKSGHCPGKGNDQHFYLRSQGWYLWNFAQQVFFQCRWPQTIESQGNGHSCKTLLLGIWPITVKTSDDFIFYRFLTGIHWFCYMVDHLKPYKFWYCFYKRVQEKENLKENQ